jgi:dTDP-4-amino-4,6-dideoxygalactose transaminase
MIPLVDLKAEHQELSVELRDAVARILGTAQFILGEEVAAFEEAFARFVGVRFCVGVANGTDALELMLRAARVSAGDEVILPVNTFIATALAVVRAGATPVFVDCDPRFHLIDVEQATRRIGLRTRAILAVHLFGQMAPMEELSDAANQAGILLFEDAAQAQGARRGGRGVGGFGLAAGTSFYPSKNLGACGDAGAVLTNSEELEANVRALRNYGSDARHSHPELGFNSRLDAVQAAILNVKLERLAGWNQARVRAAHRYHQLLEGNPSIVLPQTMNGCEHVWHLYVVRVPDRDGVLRRLIDSGIGAAVHYPTPIHLQPAFASLDYRRGDFPVAEAAAREMISLPLFPGITADQQRRVAEALQRALR